jgi:hypothetical protein
MNEETIIDYSYVLLEEYKDLEDGTPNFHHNPAIKVSCKGTVMRFLELLSYNSKIKGISIKEIDFKVVEKDSQND